MITRPLRPIEKKVLRRLRQGPLPMDHWQTMTPGANFSKALQVHICFLRQAGCVIDLVNHEYRLISEPPGLLNDEMEISGGFGDIIRLVREGNAVALQARTDKGVIVTDTLMSREKVTALIAFLQDALL